MTRNQERAYLLATAIVSGELKADSLAENDWALLLMAGALRNPLSLPLIVAHRVLNNYHEHHGYFARKTHRGTPRIFDLTMDSPQMAPPSLHA